MACPRRWRSWARRRPPSWSSGPSRACRRSRTAIAGLDVFEKEPGEPTVELVDGAGGAHARPAARRTRRDRRRVGPRPGQGCAGGVLPGGAVRAPARGRRRRRRAADRARHDSDHIGHRLGGLRRRGRRRPAVGPQAGRGLAAHARPACAGRSAAHAGAAAGRDDADRDGRPRPGDRRRDRAQRQSRFRRARPRGVRPCGGGAPGRCGRRRRPRRPLAAQPGQPAWPAWR